MFFWNSKEKEQEKGNTEIVSLYGSDSTAELSKMETYGAYIVTVQALDGKNGTHSTFLVNANHIKGGTIFRATAIAGDSNEHVTITWGKGEKPLLKYMSPPRDSNERKYRVTYFA